MGVCDNILGIFCCVSHADVVPAPAEKDTNVMLCRSGNHAAECSEGQRVVLEPLDEAAESAGCANVEPVCRTEPTGDEQSGPAIENADVRPAGAKATPPEAEPALLEEREGPGPSESVDDLGVLEEIAKYAERVRSDNPLFERSIEKDADAEGSLDGILKDHIVGQRSGKLFCPANLPIHRLESILTTARDDMEAASDYEPVSYNGFFLPPQTCGRPTLVLDLDHTLVFPSNKKPDGPAFDVTICLDGRDQQIWIVERPHLREFLDALHAEYEIVVFTAGIGEYGRAIVSRIDRDGRIAHVLHRRHCTPLEHPGGEASLYVKDLSRLGRDLRRTIIVDDREYSFLFNFANGQFIPPFTGDSGDTALVRLQEYLLQCLKLPDFSNRQCLGYE